ncbi:hypothetical protein Btru_018087 [Bulinus truncatus]|nr:hypothetical protein Btru_018087 [Bulinus truncatus]
MAIGTPRTAGIDIITLQALFGSTIEKKCPLSHPVNWTQEVNKLIVTCALKDYKCQRGHSKAIRLVIWLRTGQVSETPRSKDLILEFSYLVEASFYTCEALIGCQFTPWTDQSVETLAIRILIIFSGLCAIISFFCVIRSCCSNSHPQSFKMEGIFGVMSGVPGVAAVATFGATFPLPAVFFGWAFFLSAVSSGLILLTSIAMLSISLKYKKYFQSTTALGYDNQGYAMEWSSPAANAVRY